MAGSELRGERARLGLGALATVLGAGALPTACIFHLDDPLPHEAGGKGGTAQGGSGPESGGAVTGGSFGVGGAGGSAGTGATAAGGAAGAACNSGMKRCGEICVRIEDPAYGCSATLCNPCPGLTTATLACTNGACTITSCNTGFGDCNGSAADGCEITFRDLPPPSSPPPASVDARHATEVPKIDGLGNDAVWMASQLQRVPIAEPCSRCTTQSPIPPVAAP